MDIEPKAKYDNKVRQAVIDRILVDKLNTTAVQEAMKRDFLLELSTGFIYDCMQTPSSSRYNRVLRYLEKVRYKWRSRRTIIRHLLQQFELWMKRKENKARMAA